MDVTATALLVLLIFAGSSFFFALAESALFTLGRWQAEQLVQRYPRRGPMVMRLLDKPQDLLTTIVLGNSLSHAAMVTIGLWMGLKEYWPLLGAMAALFLGILVVCEIVPKTLAVRLPDRWSARVAGPMLLLQALTRPLRRVAQHLNTGILRAAVPKSVQSQSALTDADYQELVELAYQQGTLAKSEKEIILEIIRLDQRAAKEVMTPRLQMHCIPDDLSVEEMIAAARQFKHRRLPIYDETPDTIVGVLNTRALLLDPQIDLADAIEFPSFVPESMNLLQLFKSLQRQQRGMAIVLDEFGGTGGVITMEDILEEIIGEIRGEHESEGFLMEKLGEGRWRVNGAMRVEDFRREFPALGEVPGVETMGGLLTAQLEVVPTAGQSVLFRGLRLTAQVADDRRVREVLVEQVKKRS